MQSKTTTPPHDHEVEKLVLGSIIDYRDKFNEVRDILSDECFDDPFHKNVFAIYLQLEAEGSEIDAFSILARLKQSDGSDATGRILTLNEDTTFRTPVYRHAVYLCDLAAKRKLFSLGNYLQTVSCSADEDLFNIANRTKEVLENLYQTGQSSISTIKEAVQGVYDIINRNLSNETSLTGSPTGFSVFDKHSGGLQKSDLIIVGGESSHGKTSLALSMTLNAALTNNDRIAVYSLEMKKEQLAARLMAMQSGISSNRLLYSPLAPYQIERLDNSVSALYNSCILFDDRSTSNIDTILNSIRTMKAKHGISGVVIDYLQILNVNMKGASDEQQMASVARRLKNLAKELDIWIVALSQLNRDASNPVPNMNRVRGSGQIFEAADVVMFVYQPAKYNRDFPEPFGEYETAGYAMIDVAKGRNMGVLKFLLRFDEKLTHFTDANLKDIPQKQFSAYEKAAF
ncbi:MAG: replicative DNA helicase [Dysgonomonas sp.]